MSTERKRRYGVLLISVFMFLIVIFAGTNGSPYAVFWLYSAYLSYKGDVQTLRTWLKIVIAINLFIGITCFYFWNFEDVEWLPIFLRDKSIFIMALTFPLLVKVGILLSIRPSSSSKFSKSNSISNQQSSTLEVDDSAWEQALKEVDGADRHMATWAKALADSAGNTELARSIYIKQRANHIHIKSSIQSNFLPDDEDRLISEQQNRDHIRSFWISIAIVLICGGFLIFGAIRNS